MGMNTLANIARNIQTTIKGQTGAAVEWTFRTDDKFTVSGNPADVDAAVKFLAAHGIAKVESVEHDAELGETFAYLTK